MSAITITLGRTVAASSAGATRSTRGRTAAKKSAVEVSKRNAPVCRVVQDPAASMDVGSSIDVDMDMRRRIVQMDTATTLRKTIDVRAPPPRPRPRLNRSRGRRFAAILSTWRQRADLAPLLYPQAMGGTMIQDPAAFVSTDYHRLVTTGLFASCAALVARGGVGIEMAGDGGDPAAWASLVGSGLLAYWLSDLGTGVFHWSVDNYGSKATPVMGGIIDAFQGHHKYPWTITKRQFANNIHVTCPATMCVTVPLLLAPGLAPNACAFMGVFCSMIVLSQQFHAWSHMKKSQLPESVVTLQDLGVLLSRKGHGAHHRPPFKGNYCIVSGFWNDILDGNEVFDKMATVVYEATGVAPRCWSESHDFEVEEEAPEGWGKEYNL